MLHVRRFILAIALFTVPALLGAQSVARAEQTLVTGIQSSLQSRISLNLESVPLVSALEAIARQASLRISVNDQAARIPKTVTVRNSSITAAEAFRIALKGTNVRMSVAGDGQILFSGTAQAAATASSVVTGKVTDAKTGKGVPGANVSVGNDQNVTTNSDGLFRLSGVSAGTYTVTVRLVGYAKQTRSITVGEGATVTADFKLEPSANVLDQVIVTGTVVATELKAVPNNTLPATPDSAPTGFALATISLHASTWPPAIPASLGSLF